MSMRFTPKYTDWNKILDDLYKQLKKAETIEAYDNILLQICEIETGLEEAEKMSKMTWDELHEYVGGKEETK